MQVDSVSPVMSAVSTQANNMFVEARTRQAEQNQQANDSRQSEQLQQAQQAQKMQAASKTDENEQARKETEQAPPTVNADGQRVGTRVNTMA